MSEFLTFLELGFLHITDLKGADHVLFLLVLAAIYRFRDWREVLWVVTAFTVGHSVTLVLAVSGVLDLPAAVIEFLIPVTIVATGVENLIVANRERAPLRGRYRPVFAGVFGLVHGAGFANYLRSLFVEPITIPLLGFNVGIEVGQVAVLAVIAGAFWAVDGALTRWRAPLATPSAFRLRAVAVSALVSLVATGWAIERSPW